MGTYRMEDADGATLLRLDGFWGVEQAVELREQLMTALSHSSTVELDLAGLEGADLSFYQLLLSARRMAVEQGRGLRIRAWAEDVASTAVRQGLGAALSDAGLL